MISSQHLWNKYRKLFLFWNFSNIKTPETGERCVLVKEILPGDTAWEPRETDEETRSHFRVGGEKIFYHCRDFVSPSPFAVIWPNPAGFGCRHEITAQLLVQLQGPEGENIYKTKTFNPFKHFFQKSCNIKLRSTDFALFILKLLFELWGLLAQRQMSYYCSPN